MRHITFIFSLFLSLNCIAQVQLKDSLLKQDLELLKNMVGEVSPNLSSEEKEALYKNFDERSEELNGKTMPVLEFFRFLMISKVNSKLDEHGTLSLSDEVMRELLADKSALFPIPILIIDHKLIVNQENLQIPYGSAITEINGVQAASILDDLLREQSTFAMRNLEQSFDLLYLIKYGTPASYQISYTLPNSNLSKTIALSPIDLKTREENFNSTVYPLNRSQLRNLINTVYFEETNSFYIQLNSFNWKEEVENPYEAFNEQFDDIFKTIKKLNPKNLIIDLRYNRGGNVLIPGLFYSYIAQEDIYEDIRLRVSDFDFPYKNYIEKIGNRAVNVELVDEFVTNFQKPFTKKNGYFELSYVNHELRKPKKNNFSGNIYLMIGGRNFSAASYFTAIFKNSHRGTIIGEEIGGSHHNITAGQQIEYVLPNTNIRVSLPIGVLKFSQEIETGVPENKIVPDVVVSEELKGQYFLKKEDWDLQEVFQLIKK